jgi:DNA protecting protein DprA
VSRTLSDAQRHAWLRLSRTQNVGAVTFAQLIERYGSAEAALEALPSLVKRGGGERVRIPTTDDIDREIAALHKLGGRMLASCEPEFPRGLAAADAPPPIISVLGHVTILQREMVAIVGARNASALGRKFASTLARDLAGAGLVVASGLARGIDTAAHEGSLPGGTCAVVAGGVDNIYPPENATLYERIRNEGCIVSEMPLGQSPQARHFPRRNRIISGLSRGVVIVGRNRAFHRPSGSATGRRIASAPVSRRHSALRPWRSTSWCGAVIRRFRQCCLCFWRWNWQAGSPVTQATASPGRSRVRTALSPPGPPGSTDGREGTGLAARRFF